MSSFAGESSPPHVPPAGTTADPVPVETQVTLVIWCDWKGDMYAFCGRECQRHYAAWVRDPNYSQEKATSTDVSFGCMWCGGDLTRGVKWLSPERAADSKAARS